jgi:hypothetical protein
MYWVCTYPLIILDIETSNIIDIGIDGYSLFLEKTNRGIILIKSKWEDRLKATCITLVTE